MCAEGWLGLDLRGFFRALSGLRHFRFSSLVNRDSWTV